MLVELSRLKGSTEYTLNSQTKTQHKLNFLTPGLQFHNKFFLPLLLTFLLDFGHSTESR